MPLLKTLFVTFFDGKYPDLRNVTTVLIAGGRTIDNAAISMAKGIITLGIEDREEDGRLSCEFPRLKSLFLSGDISREVLDGFSAP